MPLSLLLFQRTDLLSSIASGDECCRTGTKPNPLENYMHFEKVKEKKQSSMQEKQSILRKNLGAGKRHLSPTRKFLWTNLGWKERRILKVMQTEGVVYISLAAA